MDENEYKSQKALDTIDYVKAARESNSREVLASIIEDTDEIDAHLNVALNPSTDCRTLTRIILEPNTQNQGLLIYACVSHPKVTSEILKRWMARDFISTNDMVRQRCYILQHKEGISKEDRITLEPHGNFEDLMRLMKKPGPNTYPNDNIANPHIQWTPTPSYVTTTTTTTNNDDIFYNVYSACSMQQIEDMVGTDGISKFHTIS